uniref:Endonuclease/exonuclease/phosphatase domain-containing protein n=1 Tax=Eutreptiella gymnastica TaxID=73025 RepID=A0A7S1N643_9EUGL|mmetsp:Transcript_124972/g.216658  ORF Transcript_124972/g.216658 Transcript_124972/m.216658 type:complete len:307 (+) Transcript_124972:80-1000(+)
MIRLPSAPLPAPCPGTLSVLSYNLLAPCYVRVPGQFWNAYPHAQDAWLDWDGRQGLIVAQVLAMDADVVCLQEVVFEERSGAWCLPTWMDAFQAAGYVGLLPGLKEKEWNSFANRNERVLGTRVCTGVAVWYKQERFEPTRPALTGNRSLTVFLTEKGAIPTTGTPPSYAIITVHLEGNQELHEKQVLQIQSVLKKLPAPFGGHVVLCGDFNSECQAGGPLAQAIRAQRWVELAEAPTGPSWAEPGLALRLDHVLHSPGLDVQAVLDMWEDRFSQIGLPNAECPSDHLPIAAVLRVKPLAVPAISE